MAAPNIVNVQTIIGKTTGVGLTTSLTTALLSNSAASGKVFKINTIMVSNVDGSNSADVTIDWYNGSSGFKIANTISVPADTSVILIGKDSPLYLEENQSIRGGANNTNDLECIISYEEIS